MSETNPPPAANLRRGAYQGEQLAARELRRAELRRSIALCQLADREAPVMRPTRTPTLRSLAAIPATPR